MADAPKPKLRWSPFTAGLVLLLSLAALTYFLSAAGGLYLADALAAAAPLTAIAWIGWLAARRRPFQFRMRTLLLVVLVCSIACSWFAVRMREARRQGEAVEAILNSEYGGVVGYDCQGWRGVCWLRPEPPQPAWLGRLLGEDFFRKVVGADVGGEQPRLGQLQRLPYLQSLRLEGDQVTDATLEWLKELPRLRALRVTHAQITDAGLKHIAGLGRLESVGIYATNVTDAALVHLREMSRLHELNLFGTLVTDDGVNELRQALPDCTITRK